MEGAGLTRTRNGIAAVTNEHDDGWLRLHRQALASEAFCDANLWKVWCWCMLRANYKPAWVSVVTGRGKTTVRLETGQFIFGRKEAAESLRMSGTSVERRIRSLEKMGNLARKVDTHYSVISICKWAVYQPDANTSGQASDGGQANSQKVVRQVVAHIATTSRCPVSTYDASESPRGQASGQANLRKADTDKKETEEETAKQTTPSSASADVTSRQQRVMDAWNGLGTPFPKVRRLTPKRRVALNARLDDPAWCTDAPEALKKIKASTFCRGEAKGSQWVANFDWFIRPDSVTRAAEGNYEGGQELSRLERANRKLEEDFRTREAEHAKQA